ncbi:holo-ACP synthase [Curtobacterium sp. C1]|jgi:holo-[acyl-carrier protein] synthase|uniref:Holo-[acyl-carrier-protein] synthase n=1 Tax=Curtobacterium citreum TaxID=2036 RepID=A0A850DWK1_9MICO|nr:MULTISPECIES: holo-ACP synthase [Curtobacterium]MCS5488027.1 holo-ACP synthase [Curtobacterium flaccumfaciens pv. basellae]KTR08762.1 4'-phosphopantetheinyl transferase [Curtobacterium citreum]NUU29794.1 holo-ACP synthase [Curtobacterium albidum]QKS13054.1 holo-ACP synthase [Curtobacterium sp. csp3]QKS15152.1 holo-ACP synthase [Curtobacterium sp. Csp2]
MIIGIGVDVVDLDRFERVLDRTPAMRTRLFTPSELLRDGEPRPSASLAARFAAKEALIKAFGSSAGLSWQDLEVVSDDQRNPSLTLRSGAQDVADRRGVSSVHLSLSHDGGIATAFVVIEGAGDRV